MQQLQAAVQAYQGKDLDSAEAIFKQILALNPKEPNALHFLGCIYKDRGQLQQAVELIQASIQVDGSNPTPFLNLGKILSIAGQHENAAGIFQESLKRNQQIPETWFCFANALREVEKIAESKQAYRNALQLNPAHAGAASNLGALLTDDGELEEAELLFVKAVDQYPNDVNLRINYGKLLAEKDEDDAALVQYQIALPLAPRSPELLYNFAILLKRMGCVGQAVEMYQKSIELKPDFAKAYLNLATCLHEESDIKDALSLYASALAADDQVSACRFHLCATGDLDLTTGCQALQPEVMRFLQQSGDLLQNDLLFLRCLSDFSERLGMKIEIPAELSQVFSPKDLSPRYSLALDDVFGAYALCRKLALPRWMLFEDVPSSLLSLSDYLESLRVKSDFLTDDWMSLKDYQLSMTSVESGGLPALGQLFVKEDDPDELLWLSAERFQFPDLTTVLSLRESLLKKISLPPASRQDQSEFFRKAHLLDAQKFYMAEEDPCLHGMSELYRVHGLIVDTIREMEGLQSVVDLGYYSCGIFNAGLKPDLKRYCIEPARHHAVWAAESGIAEVVPDVPLRCVRSFEEYLSRLDAVALDDLGSTAAVISFIFQLFEYDQCVEILQRVKEFASNLVVTDDILNEESEESILRLLSNGKRMNLCHNYQRLLSDAGWVIEKKWYFHGVRYASGIIVASAA